MDGKINLRIQKDYIFLQTCIHGQLDIAKWLLSLDGNIDIHTSRDYSLKEAYINGYLNVAKWLVLLSNDDYEYIFSDYLPDIEDIIIKDINLWRYNRCLEEMYL